MRESLENRIERCKNLSRVYRRGISVYGGVKKWDFADYFGVSLRSNSASFFAQRCNWWHAGHSIGSISSIGSAENVAWSIAKPV